MSFSASARPPLIRTPLSIRPNSSAASVARCDALLEVTQDRFGVVFYEFRRHVMESSECLCEGSAVVFSVVSHAVAQLDQRPAGVADQRMDARLRPVLI